MLVLHWREQRGNNGSALGGSSWVMPVLHWNRFRTPGSSWVTLVLYLRESLGNADSKLESGWKMPVLSWKEWPDNTTFNLEGAIVVEWLGSG